MKNRISAKASRIMLLSSTAFGILATEAAAQTINYGALEQMFGEPVTTSATGKPQTVSDAPANMIIVTAEDIRRSGATTIADLPSRVLKNYPGIDVQQASLGAANVGIDGYDQAYSPKLLVLVNGRQVYLDHYGYTEWSTIPVELAEIRQVEIIKGPASALFGFNAANGVINIVTFSPLYDNVREASVTAGSGSYVGGSAVVTGHVGDNFGVRLSTGGDRGNEFKDWSAKSTPFEHHPGRSSLSADSLAKIGDATQFGVEVTRTLSSQTDIISGGSGAETSYRTWSVKGSLTSETSIGLLSAQIYHNAATIATEEVGDYFSNGVTVVQLSDLFKVNDYHSLREAVEFRRNELSGDLTDHGTIAYDVIADSVMWDWQILPTVNWTNAGRIDHLTLSRSGPLPSGLPTTNASYNRSFNAYSYNSTLVDKITDQDTIRLAVGQSVQAPSLLELGMASVSSTNSSLMVVAGSANINPTIIKKYEVGYSRSMPGIGLTFNNSLFYQKTDQTQELQAYSIRLPQGALMLSGNTGNSTERGIETGLNYKLANGLALDANYTFSSISDDLVSGASITYRNGTPRHKVNLHAGYTLGKLELDGYGHYVSRIYQQSLGSGGGDVTAVSGYFELDARVGYHLTEAVTLGLSGSSIDLAHHQEDSGATVDRRVTGTVSVKF